MTGRQSAAAAAGELESLGTPLKAHRVLEMVSADLVKAFPCSSTRLCFIVSSCSSVSSLLFSASKCRKQPMYQPWNHSSLSVQSFFFKSASVCYFPDMAGSSFPLQLLSPPLHIVTTLSLSPISCFSNCGPVTPQTSLSPQPKLLFSIPLILFHLLRVKRIL